MSLEVSARFFPSARTAGIRPTIEVVHPLAVRLLRRDDLAGQGIGARRLSRLVQAEVLVAVRPGVYAWTEETGQLTPEGRMVVRARALHSVSRRPPVFSHQTAAALHGLPLVGPDLRKVHIIAAADRPSSGRGVVRHRGEVPDDDLQIVDGMLCTSLARTVADVARTAPFEPAVCVGDAALRLVAHGEPGSYLIDRAAEFVSKVRTIAALSAHGRRRSDAVLAFCDGRAQRPGESISRIRLVELGYASPELQVRVTGRDGRDDYVDFGLPEAHALGEFDGRAKYADAGMLNGRTPAQVLDEEKQREDWIRGVTQLKFARWGWEHLRSAFTLGERLSRFGIVPQL